LWDQSRQQGNPNGLARSCPLLCGVDFLQIKAVVHQLFKWKFAVAGSEKNRIL
jgi:hypothetical protein